MNKIELQNIIANKVGDDIIPTLFNEETMRNMVLLFDSELHNIDIITPPLTVSERCYLAAIECQELDFALYRNQLFEGIHSMNTEDKRIDKEYDMRKMIAEKNHDNVDDSFESIPQDDDNNDFEAIHLILQIDEFSRQKLYKILRLDKDKISIIEDELKHYEATKSIDNVKEFGNFYYDYYETITRFIGDYFLLELQKQYDLDKANYKKEDVIKTIRAYKRVIETGQYKSLYKLWENLQSPNNQDSLNSSAFNQLFSRSDSLLRERVEEMLCNYFYVYSNRWHKGFFGSMVKNMCELPEMKVKFIRNMNNHLYLMDFRDEYEKFLKETDATPIFPIESLLINTPELMQDTAHLKDGWYSLINTTYLENYDQTQELEGDNAKILYLFLRKLYNRLIEQNIFINTSMELFIYRFSGLLAPHPLTTKIQINPKIKKNYIAYLLSLLYDSKKYKRPQFHRINSYFEPKFSNISALAASLKPESEKKIKQMLYECGFLCKK